MCYNSDFSTTLSPGISIQINGSRRSVNIKNVLARFHRTAKFESGRKKNGQFGSAFFCDIPTADRKRKVLNVWKSFWMQIAPWSNCGKKKSSIHAKHANRSDFSTKANSLQTAFFFKSLSKIKKTWLLIPSVSAQSTLESSDTKKKKTQKKKKDERAWFNFHNQSIQCRNKFFFISV